MCDFDGVGVEVEQSALAFAALLMTSAVPDLT